MSSANENEITGDWNNLKGTEYHLVYALWLTLKVVTLLYFFESLSLFSRVTWASSLHKPTLSLNDSPTSVRRSKSQVIVRK